MKGTRRWLGAVGVAIGVLWLGGIRGGVAIGADPQGRNGLEHGAGRIEAQAAVAPHGGAGWLNFDPGDDPWPAAGADGRYRVIDACRYDPQLQREHERILCEGHRVLWRVGEQLRQEALDSVRWYVIGGALGTTAKSIRRATLCRDSAVLPLRREVVGLAKFYPEHAGFVGATERRFLEVGERIDRYGGSAYSRFFSPQGTPAWARSLPPGIVSQPLRTFEVMKPFEVSAGRVAPWFNQPGGGIQYVTPVTLDIFLKRGIIQEIMP
ncbi:MAG: TNT domain-containing protein [Verrucomicrobia bacterium]|nr:TNT domain-containing protein [Verrucomicrobiota bacterium]